MAIKIRMCRRSETKRSWAKRKEQGQNHAAPAEATACFTVCASIIAHTRRWVPSWCEHTLSVVLSPRVRPHPRTGLTHSREQANEIAIANFNRDSEQARLLPPNPEAPVNFPAGCYSLLALALQNTNFTLLMDWNRKQFEY